MSSTRKNKIHEMSVQIRPSFKSFNNDKPDIISSSSGTKVKLNLSDYKYPICHS